MRSICKDPSMPGAATVSRWLTDDDKPEFREQYRLAYEANLMVEAYSMREMIDEVEPTMAAIAKVREQMAHRKWELRIQFPKKYSDNPEPVAQEVAPVEELNNLTVEERAELLRLKRKMNGQ